MVASPTHILNLCVFLCDTVHNNVTQKGLLYEHPDVLSRKVVEAQKLLPFNVSAHKCEQCELEGKSSYVPDASSYVKFLLYTRASGNKYTELKINDPLSLRSGGFDLSKKTKIVVHGFLSSGVTSMAEVVRKAVLKAADINVIAVDWSPMVNNVIRYFRSTHAVLPVGKYTAKLVDFLVTDMGVSLDDIHLVGHSLGAHVCGVAGASVTSGKITRITGLDPAGPGFDEYVPTEGLDAADAKFVDVIHTCNKILGRCSPMGTVDFFPNGGLPSQPGCQPFHYTVCSHSRAYYYYAESLSSRDFVGTQCVDWETYTAGCCSHNKKSVMGEFVDRSATGEYFLRTRSESPFAAGNDSANLHDSFNSSECRNNL